jgi:hypothetical protein
MVVGRRQARRRDLVEIPGAEAVPGLADASPGALSDLGKARFMPAPACQSAGGPGWARRDYPYLKSLPTDAAGMLAAIRRSTGQPSPTDRQ